MRDLEVPIFPRYNNNKVGVTELSIYGIDAKELEKNRKNDATVPELPRVLHKIKLMFNPLMDICREAASTGLNNCMLQDESPFNNNAASTVLNFLKNLRQPVCLVAHNGYQHDFKIVKHLLNEVKQTMPETIYCIDSMRAFSDIDQEKVLKYYEDLNAVQAAEIKVDTRTQNETTPERPTTSIAAAATKRKRNDNDENSDVECDNLENTPTKARRKLDFGELANNMNIYTNLSYQKAPGEWRPIQGQYRLVDVYTRTFSKYPTKLHHAEADVIVLTQLMLHYGEDFIDYAERHAITFQSVPRFDESPL